MSRRKEVPRAKHRERQQIKQAGGGREGASTHLKRPTVMLDDEAETYSVIVEREPSSPRLTCCECDKGIAGQPYQFGGSLACEQCVTNYYRSTCAFEFLSKDEWESLLTKELAAELPWRAREGDRLLREKEGRKRRDAF
jgi:hypothetical protein